MAKYIPLSVVLAEIKDLLRKNELYLSESYTDEVRYQRTGAYSVLNDLLHFIDTIEVKEVDNTPNIRFPHYKSIVEKVFGAGNLESFEYDEAEQLVSLAKEELLKDLEVKEINSKDAFIEKAWEFIEDNLLSSNQQDKSRLYYEQFKNYMKGE
jgi:hypothetical protein